MLAPGTRLVGDGEGMPTGPFCMFFVIQVIGLAGVTCICAQCVALDQFAPAMVFLSLA